jgi:type I restriction enzyme, S subunit
MSFPRYDVYKESGVEWLGEVPKHWEMRRLKTLMRLMTERAVTRERSIALENVESWSGGLIETDSEFEGDGVAFNVGDLLFGKLRPYLAKLYVAQFSGEAVGDFHVLRPAADLVSRFAFYQLVRREVISVIDGSTFGAKMPRVSWEFMTELPLLVPPVFEQTAIAAFLDRETATIDALVEEQQRLIALLKEKRQAVISHAVAKGLDPNAPMKDSGVEWLGEVPAHWQIMRVKRACGLIKDGTNLPPPRVGEGIPLLSVRNVEGGSFNFRDDDSLISEADYAELCRAFVPMAGDVLLAIVGATLGKSAIVQDGLGKFHIQRSLAIFRTTQSVDSAWLHSVFLSDGFQHLLWQHVGYSAQPGIYLGALADFAIPVPPEFEQSQIMAFVGAKQAKFDALVDEAEAGIALLQERRSALISAAVTGKIDVCGLAPASAEAA